MSDTKETTSNVDKEDDESIKSIFSYAMNLFKKIESSDDPTNSDAVQLSVKLAISKFEKVTNLVSFSGMFSSNESVEDLPTETMQYLLLPAILGTLSLKLCGRPRKDIIGVAEIYFKDFLQRCKDYGITNVEIPEPSTETTLSTYSEQAKIANLIQIREQKIRRFKEQKELQSKLNSLEHAMNSASVDDETRRDYFLSLIQSYILQAVDELSSIESEKPMLEYMEKHGAETKPKRREPPTPLKPIIITRDAIQKAVFGAGYPSIHTLTIEEFYDQRVREGTFPGACNIPHQTIQTAEPGSDEPEAVERERLIETDDAAELARQRNMDEYKDDHRRGWGNRYNRS